MELSRGASRPRGGGRDCSGVIRRWGARLGREIPGATHAHRKDTVEADQVGRQQFGRDGAAGSFQQRGDLCRCFGGWCGGELRCGDCRDLAAAVHGGIMGVAGDGGKWSRGGVDGFLGRLGAGSLAWGVNGRAWCHINGTVAVVWAGGGCGCLRNMKILQKRGRCHGRMAEVWYMELLRSGQKIEFVSARVWTSFEFLLGRGSPTRCEKMR
jgi:hypothetical protein